MSAYIINAAPMVIQYGTQDLSSVQLPRVPENIPQHLPKFYLWAKKGPLTPQLVSGVELANMYGVETFDERSPYCNHATIFANKINAQGNAIMVERLLPSDAGPLSNLVLWLDVLETTVTKYEREADGSIKLDIAGLPVIATGGPIPGYKIKWVATFNNTVLDQAHFGELTQVAGSQTDVLTSTQSVRYPIFELKASSPGAWGNNVGFRLSAPTNKSTLSMPTAMMAKERAYPYYFSVIERDDATSTPKIVPTLYGDQSVLMTFKPNVIDPLTDAQLYMGDVALSNYQNVTNLRYPIQQGTFGSLAIYDANIKTVCEMLHDTEKTHIDSFSDITANVDDAHLMNIVSGVSSQGVPYHSVQFIDNPDSIEFTEYTNMFAKGGSDGTMTDASFAAKVSSAVKEYANQSSPLQETAINVESIIYDSGFPLATKYDLCNFIAVRGDTFVVLSTHEAGTRKLTSSEEMSLAIALRTRLQMYPESDYFGTPVMRGMIVGRSAKLLNSRYKDRLPLSLEIAIKSAKYMGAGSGRWKNGANFDGAPGSVVDYMYDISIPWVSAGVRNQNWDVGLNWVQAYDRRSFFFPALKTVYDDDTSVLNSYFVALAIGQLNKLSNAAWREFSGVSNLTNAQLAQRVNDFVKARVSGIFDNRFVIVPAAYFTDMDLKRGYSWTLPIKIYAPNMKTVMTTYVQAYRLDDFKSA